MDHNVRSFFFIGPARNEWNNLEGPCRKTHISRLMTKPTKWLCTQRRLRSVWASAQSNQSSLCAQWGKVERLTNVAIRPTTKISRSYIIAATGKVDRVKRIWYLSPMRAAKVQASLRIRAVSPEPSLLAHTSSESRGTCRQKARSLAPLNGWACAVEMCHDGMLEDTNSLGGAQVKVCMKKCNRVTK